MSGFKLIIKNYKWRVKEEILVIIDVWLIEKVS